MMIGRQASGQERLPSSVSLEDHVSQDHLLRGLDRFLDLGDLRSHLTPFHSHTGRPSVDPELTMRGLIVAYGSGTRSERRFAKRFN